MGLNILNEMHFAYQQHSFSVHNIKSVRTYKSKTVFLELYQVEKIRQLSVTEAWRLFGTKSICQINVKQIMRLFETRLKLSKTTVNLFKYVVYIL